jgi:hypothetical protein
VNKNGILIKINHFIAFWRIAEGEEADTAVKESDSVNEKGTLRNINALVSFGGSERAGTPIRL